nr:DUF3025 domain-containing protein [Rugamonas sp. CCM 8940]
MAAGAEGYIDNRFIDKFCAQAAALDLCNHQGLPLRFVAQGELPEGTAYEAFIGATGGVPTRDNLHDFFNALVWLSFPRIKVTLNALQAAQIARDGVGKSRGPARDAATIYDENAALLVVRDNAAGHALVEALRGHRWSEVFVERRASFAADAQLWLFGHALMEKLVAPRKAITAHTRVVLAGDDYFALDGAARRAWLDAHEADALAARDLGTADFTPLPVLGVPGWWPRQDQAFYDDVSVFRPKRGAPAE